MCFVLHGALKKRKSDEEAIAGARRKNKPKVPMLVAPRHQQFGLVGLLDNPRLCFPIF